MENEELRVYLNGRCVGALLRVKDAMRFRYCEEVVLEKKGLPLLSTALPVQAEAFDAARTRNWFAGLLPEDDRLHEVRRFFGIRSDDWADVLEEIGWECAGAVEVLPEGRVPPSRRDCESPATASVALSDLSKRLAALPAHPFDDRSTMRVSLGGFQEKLCVVLPESMRTSPGTLSLDRIGLPIDGAPTTHILKPQPNRFPNMVEGEAWGMAVASRATETARTALLECPDAPMTLVVERFDRTRHGGDVVRIHQEDCCQALGLAPGAKYASSSSAKGGDPTFRAIAGLLSSYAEDPLHEMLRLLRQMATNLVLGNTDAHAKNYALLHPTETSVSLAPLYDVIPACEITPNVVAMGMRIGGRIRIDRIGREQVLEEAASWGLPRAMVRRELDETFEALRDGVDYATDVYPAAGQRHAAFALERLEKLQG